MPGSYSRGLIGVYDSLDDKSSNECDDVGDVLLRQRRLPGWHVTALADGEASFGYHGGQIFVGNSLDVAFAGKRPDMWHEPLAAAPAVRAVTALAILQEDRFAVPRIPGRNRRRYHDRRQRRRNNCQAAKQRRLRAIPPHLYWPVFVLFVRTPVPAAAAAYGCPRPKRLQVVLASSLCYFML